MNDPTPKRRLITGIAPTVTLYGALFAFACSGSEGNGGAGSAAGSSPSTETTTTTGGSVNTTVAPATGGLSTVVTGVGGTTTTNSAAGGTSTVGTTVTNGGTGSTTSATGGTSSTAGGSTATGGTKATGGSTATGGTKATGGSTATGGTKATGGSTATGGTTNAGGSGDLCNAGVWDGSTKPTPLTLSGNTFAHDPTMIAVNGTYYRYWTGNNIPAAKSTNLTNWTNITSVYTSGYPAWSTTWLAGISGQTFNFPWAPDVSFFNGKYHIYSSFSAKFGDNISCITHLTTSDIATGGWTDNGTVICTNGSENYNAIDADVGIDALGAPYLAFGSFWNGIMATPLNADGTRKGTTLTQLANASQIEAPVLFYRCGYYYLFVTWGLCCPGEGRTIDQLTYRVVVGRSTNILGPYVDKTGKTMVSGGGTLMVEGDDVTWAAAGHSDVLASGSKIYHLYHAYRQSDGGAQLRIVEMPFDSAGWPVPAGP